MTTETKAVLTLSAENVKVFTFDGATIIFSRGVNRQIGPGVLAQIIDSNNPRNKEPDADGIIAAYAVGSSFTGGRERLLVEAERHGIKLPAESKEEHAAIDWQQVQDMGDRVVTDMIAEIDEEHAEAEIVGFRELKPAAPNVGGNPLEMIAELLGRL